MRAVGFLLLSAAAIADQDDSSGLLQKKKKMKSHTMDTLGTDPPSASCSAYGDPHFSTFDGESQGAHCFGPLGDYDIVKTDKLSIQARYKGRDDSRAEVAVIRGVTISGSLLGEAVISIPPMNFIDHKAWAEGASTIQGPSVLKPDNTLLSGSDLVCANFGVWRTQQCFDQKDSTILDWMEHGKLWDATTSTVQNVVGNVTEKQARQAFGKWTRYMCNKEKYSEICPKTVEFDRFTLRHGSAPRAKVISQPCEGPLTPVQQANKAKCGHCSCSPNSWIVEVPNVVTIIVNQGTNQGLGITIHDRSEVTSTGEITGQCGNYNSDPADDVFPKWQCPHMILPPLQQLPPGPPNFESMQVFPPIVTMQDLNPQSNMVVQRASCSEHEEDIIHDHCVTEHEASDVAQCEVDCCVQRHDPHTVLPVVCGIDLTLDPVPDIVEQEPCHLNDDYHAIVNQKCEESEVANGFTGDKLTQQVATCIYDCCQSHDMCPQRGDDGLYMPCLVTTDAGSMKVKPFVGDSSMHGNFQHNDYWLMETDALSVQGRFSSNTAKPALRGIALTGYLLGEPRSDEEDTGDDAWPVIEVKNTDGISSVEVDGEVHTTNFDTTCFSVSFGPQPSVKEAAAPVPGVYLDMLQIQASEHAESVLVIVKDCLFGGAQLAGITVNNHADGTQDAMISSSSVLTDSFGGFTDSLAGHCDSVGGDPVDQSDSLFSVAHPTVGEGCMGDHLIIANDNKCPYNDDARIFKELHLELEECFQMCSTDDNCEFFSYAEFGQHAGMCMGCTDAATSQHHVNFTYYQVCNRVTTTTTTTTTPPCTDGYWLLKTDRKCDYQKANRMWRLEEQDETSCYHECASDETCKYFSIGSEQSSHPNICMGCDETTSEEGEYHKEFTFFKVCKWDSDRKTCPKHVHHQCHSTKKITEANVNGWEECRTHCRGHDQCEWWAFDGNKCEICRSSFIFTGRGKSSTWDTFSRDCDDEAMHAFFQR